MIKVYYYIGIYNYVAMIKVYIYIYTGFSLQNRHFLALKTVFFPVCHVHFSSIGPGRVPP